MKPSKAEQKKLFNDRAKEANKKGFVKLATYCKCRADKK